nr:MAG TPA: hypothetical protein [Caudoviricetes sp.]
MACGLEKSGVGKFAIVGKSLTPNIGHDRIKSDE